MQVSRLGNPLFNEVIVPVGDKDRWNALIQSTTSSFAKYVDHPELAKLLPILYPGAFPNLAALHAERADLHAILLTGIPGGIVPGFQNFTGPKPADMLRLNVAIPPTTSNPNALGARRWRSCRLPERAARIRRRRLDRAEGGGGRDIPLVDPSYMVGRRGQCGLVVPHAGTDRYQSTFPYLGTPHDGFHTPSS